MEQQSGRLRGKLKINAHVWEDQLRNLRGNALGREEGSLTQIQSTLQKPRPDDKTSPRYSISQGWALVDEGRVEEALNEAGQVPQSHPHYYLAVVLGAHCLRAMGDLEEAEAEIDRAMKLSRKPAEALIQRAWLRRTQKKFQEGIEAGLQALDICRGDVREVSVCRVLSYIYVETGRVDEALPLLDRLLEIKPDDADIRLQRSQAFHTAGLQEKAIIEIDAALMLNRNHLEAVKFSNRIQPGKLCQS
jgi:tetratricopeptide (TPR) repeat protein